MLSKKVTPIRLSEACQKAWDYLVLHKVNCAKLLREGGENLIISRANEFYMNKNNLTEKVPSWVNGGKY